MKIRCPNCEKIVTAKTVTRMVTLKIRNKTISIQTNGYVCSECGDFIFDEQSVLDNAYDIYQAQTGVNPRLKVS